MLRSAQAGAMTTCDVIVWVGRARDNLPFASSFRDEAAEKQVGHELFVGKKKQKNIP